ncbi:MAG TPA: lipid-A-disaccharide synthase, partial [Aquificaceae bacterium]|nr:lipid-A-disaccharide synthase [Aquificaceae bacterium]
MKVFLSVGDTSAAGYVYEIFREFPLHISLSGITEERLESIGVKSVG